MTRKQRTPEQNQALLQSVVDFSEKYPQFALSAICKLTGWSTTTMNSTIVRTGIQLPERGEVKHETIKDHVYFMFEQGDIEGIEAFHAEVEAMTNIAWGDFSDDDVPDNVTEDEEFE